jgi:uncharacterized membrane protein YdjX (TVP38/TMEM64 family)
VSADRDSAGVERSRALLVAVLATLAAIAALALLTIFVDPLGDAVSAAVHGDSAGVRESIRDLGIGGPLIVLGLCLVHAVLWYPAEIVTAASGFVYGFWGGFALVMFGWLLNGLAAYAIGRSVGHPLLHRLGRERFQRAERMVARGGVTLLLSARLVPIFPFSLISYAAGAARVPPWRFTWTTLLGYTPITAIAAYLGSRLEDLSVTDPIVIVAFSVVAGLMLAVRWFGKSTASEPPAPEKAGRAS